ncbi:MAG TPA: hypothetical protein VMT52_14020 [Planctomycetota bacterium]|nr:hypothetical protein [Planctomycetota bacterium]
MIHPSLPWRRASLALALWTLISCEGGRREAAPRPGGGPTPASAVKEGEDAARSAARKAASALQDASGYVVGPVASPGVLEVSAVYTGETIPEPTEVPVNVDVPFCGHKVFTEDVLVDRETRGLKNVVVRLEGIAKGKAPPSMVTVTNRNCAFDPHVSVAVKGMRIDVRNADPVLHTTHPYVNGSSLFNLSLAAGAEPPPPRPIARTGLMEINCDIHKWMRAYVVIHTNPYIDVTGKEGKLKLEDIPAGRYPFVAWHEHLGEKRGEVEIAAGQTTQLRLEFAPSR